VSQKIPVKINTIALDSLLAGSDIITFHVPGGQMISNTQIDKMKTGVILINTARGGVIGEEALLKGLDNGKIAHACLDVFDNEPRPSSTILKHPRISLSPHI